MNSNRILLAILAMVFALAVSSPALAKKSLPAINDEGMELVKDTKLTTVYADPGADLSTYNRILLQDATVAFKKNWQRDQNRSNRFKVRTEDMERIQEDVATLFREVFTKELLHGGYELTEEIGALDQDLKAWHAGNEASRRLAAIPGVGVITATALAATVTDPDQFRSGRQFAAWLGLTPQQHSTGGKTRLGGISKQGDRYLRRLLVVGATAVMRHAKRNPTPMTDWVNGLLEKKPFRLVSVALANKLARIAWVLLTRGETYRPYGRPV